MHNLHKQTAANNRTALLGGEQSEKNGFAAYCANVNATIACVNEKKQNYILFGVSIKNKLN